MDFIPIKMWRVAKRLFPDYVWDHNTTEKVIYLTFDDGPTPEITNWTLDVLKQHQAKATFFCIGKNIEKYPDIFQNIAKEGHAIGNHTHNHLKGWKTKTNNYLNNILEAQKIIDTKMKGYPPVNLFRPPYGQITPKQGKILQEKGYKIIMWDVLSIDWKEKITPETCLTNVLNNTNNGSIVVFHDSLKASKNMQFALPKVLEYFGKNGYVFKSLEF